MLNKKKPHRHAIVVDDWQFHRRARIKGNETKEMRKFFFVRVLVQFLLFHHFNVILCLNHFPLGMPLVFFISCCIRFYRRTPPMWSTKNAFDEVLMLIVIQIETCRINSFAQFTYVVIALSFCFTAWSDQWHFLLLFLL